MQKAKRWMIAVVLLAAMLACFGAAAEKPEADTWTVLIYMCGGDLEARDGVMSYCLNEIAQSTNIIPLSYVEDDWMEEAQDAWKEMVHVLIETGGAAKWHTENELKYPALHGLKVSSDKIQRYSKSMDPGTTGLDLLEELPLRSMADPWTLKEFIQWGIQKYPAAHYVLIITGHGDGSRTGLLSDQLFHNDFFYLDQLREGLEMGGVVFDVLGIHSCMMANLETAVMVQPYARYMVSSEEYTPAAGMNYKDVLNELYKNPGMDAFRLARRFCDTIDMKYSTTYESEQYADMLTYSVVDLQKIPTLEEAFNAMFEDICFLYENKPGLFSLASECILGAETYGLDNERMRDLGSVLRSENMQSCIRRKVWLDCVKALDDAVVYQVRGSARGQSSGLAFCYDPAMSAGQMEAYARNSRCAPLLALLDAINAEWTAPEWVYEEKPMLKDLKFQTAYDIRYTIEAGEDGPVLRMEDTIQSGILGVANVEYLLYKENEKAEEAPYLIGRDSARIITKSYKDGRISEGYTPDINGIWPVIDGVLYPIVIMENGNDYDLYNTQILCDDEIYKLREIYRYYEDIPEITESEDGTITFREMTDGEFEFLGLWKGYDSNVTHPYHNIQPVSSLQGRKYQLLYPLYDAKGSGKVRYRKGPELTMYHSIAIEELPLPAGTYYCAFVLEDIFCRTYTTDMIQMEWDGKKMLVTSDLPTAG